MAKRTGYSTDKTYSIRPDHGFLVPNWDQRGIQKDGYSVGTDYNTASTYIDPDEEQFKQGNKLTLSQVVEGGTYHFGSGTVTKPAVSWSQDKDTGRYLIGDGNPGESIAGTLVYDWNATRHNFAIPVYLDEDADATAPALAWPTDPDSGLYRIAADQYGVSVAGTRKWYWTSSVFWHETALVVGTGSANHHIFHNGNSTNPNARIGVSVSGGWAVALGNTSDTDPTNDSYTNYFWIQAGGATFAQDLTVQNQTGTVDAFHADIATGHCAVGRSSPSTTDHLYIRGSGNTNASLHLEHSFTGPVVQRHAEIYLDSSGDLHLEPLTAGANISLDADVTLGGTLTLDALNLTDATNQLVFDSDGNAGTLTWTPSASRTITLPDATGTVPLGTGTANRVTYWTGTNAIGAVGALTEHHVLHADANGLPEGSANLTFDGSVLAANIIRGGTVTEGATAGDFVSGLDGAGRIIFDQSVPAFYLNDASDQALFEMNASVAGAARLWLRDYNVTGGTATRIANSSGDLFFVNGSQTKSIIWRTTPSGGPETSRMWLTSTGNLGINTSGPDRRLDVLDASNPQMRLTHTDGSVYSEFQATSAGGLTITTSASDLFLSPGGGNVKFGTHTTLGAETVTGYITIKDSGGTSRKIAVVS